MGRLEKQLLQNLLAKTQSRGCWSRTEQPTGFWAAADLLSPLRLGQAVPAGPASVLLHRASRGRLAPAESCQARNPVRLLAQMAWQLPLFPRPCYIWTMAMMMMLSAAATTVPCHTQVRCSWPASWLCWLGRGQREAPREGARIRGFVGKAWARGLAWAKQSQFPQKAQDSMLPRAHLVGRQGQPLPLLHPHSRENPCPASRHEAQIRRPISPDGTQRHLQFSCAPCKCHRPLLSKAPFPKELVSCLVGGVGSVPWHAQFPGRPRRELPCLQAVLEGPTLARSLAHSPREPSRAVGSPTCPG